MKIRILTSIFLVLITLASSSPANSVEFGQDATGDSNAVKVGGGSGFLYSERIVLTVAHVIESTGGLAYWEREGVIYQPGIVSVLGQRKYRVKKVIIPNTYIAQDDSKMIKAVDDLAVIVLSEDIPLTKKAVIATEDQLKRYVKDKSKVELVGYGFTNGNQRNMTFEQLINKPPNRLTSTLISPEMVIQFYKDNPNGLPSWIKIKDGVYGIVQHRENKESHLCDGDSGSAFYVEENNVRYVLGMTGMGIINNNCPPPERWYGAPSMSWIDPASKLPQLIKTAEQIVEEDRKKESTQIEGKSSTEGTKKKTINCIKGKLTKKVTGTNPKCPTGYKKV